MTEFPCIVVLFKSKEMLISCRGRESAAYRREGSTKRNRRKRKRVGWMRMNFIDVYLLRIILLLVSWRMIIILAAINNVGADGTGVFLDKNGVFIVFLSVSAHFFYTKLNFYNEERE